VIDVVPPNKTRNSNATAFSELFGVDFEQGLAQPRLGEMIESKVGRCAASRVQDRGRFELIRMPRDFSLMPSKKSS